MEPIKFNPDNSFFIEVNENDYLIEYEIKHNRLYGKVISVDRDGEMYLYVSHVDRSLIDQKTSALIYYHFTIIWRGVWEGRIYPDESEYFAEELPLLNEIWLALEPKVQELIKTHRIKNKT